MWRQGRLEPIFRRKIRNCFCPVRWKSPTAANKDAPNNSEGMVPQHRLEQEMGTWRAVSARRAVFAEDLQPAQAAGLAGIPWDSFDSADFFEEVHGRNCENVVGFVPLPVGLVGPLPVNGERFVVPLATTEGALVASTNRGVRAIREACPEGVTARVVRDGMTRSPVLQFPSTAAAADFADWIGLDEVGGMLTAWFAETTAHGRLKCVRPTVAGRYVFLRFEATTGDAMGMNMVGKGVNHIIAKLLDGRTDGAKLISLSSNMCTDKKSSSLNWTQGRGKSVVCEVVLSKEVVERVLKTTIPALVELNIAKNLVGSALAGSIGGNNAHSANIVTAVFIATGQDPAQNVESSHCMVLLESIENGDKLHASVTMPSIEVGTIGGGTALSTQKSCLEMLGVQGADPDNPGANAAKLSQIMAATVLAGELSLNAALSSNHLISAHMQLNRNAPKQASSLKAEKRFEKSDVQPGLKKQRTSHDTELIDRKLPHQHRVTRRRISSPEKGGSNP